MKQLLAFTFLILSCSSFAQVCEVDMINRYNQVVRTFRAYGDHNTCIEGMKECRKTIRLEPRLGGVDCIRRGDYNPYPNPIPNPSDISYYLRMSDYQLAQEALYGLGNCQVTQGGYNSACDYYVKVGYTGFGGGTGCAKREYMYQYGCNNYNEFENAGCLIRIALQRRQCL